MTWPLSHAALKIGAEELGNAIFDQRRRFVLSGVYRAPLDIMVGGIATLASGLPYNFVTGVTNSGDTGATADRPVINGAVVGRNTGRGMAIYDLSSFVGKRLTLGPERLHANLRAEAFNLLNHGNVVGFSACRHDQPVACARVVVLSADRVLSMTGTISAVYYAIKGRHIKCWTDAPLHTFCSSQPFSQESSCRPPASQPRTPAPCRICAGA